MASATQYPTSVTDMNTGLVNQWSNLSRIMAADASRATWQCWVSDPDLATGKGNNLGFDSVIPAGATITGVFLEINCNGDAGNPGRISNIGLCYELGGTPGTYHDISGASTSPADYVYDVTADRVWTRADLLDANFKIRVRAVRAGGGSSQATASVDYARVRVTYNTAPTDGQLWPSGKKGTAPTTGLLLPRRVLQ